MRDLIIIGGGVAGLVTASVAGQLGLDVVLVEKANRLGGDCLHFGCVPSKTLIHSAKVAALMRGSRRFGLPGTDPEIALGPVMDRVHEVIEEIQAHDDPERFRGYGVEVLFGGARFTGPREIEVKGERLMARRFLIATGSRPAVPPIPGLAETGFLTNETVFARRDLPPRLAVMGGGPIGIELAQAFARLGSKVTVLEMAPEILPREDAGIAAELRGVLRDEGIDVRVGTRVDRAERNTGGKILYATRGEEREPFEVDELLLAAGRLPNIEGLDLEAAGVDYGRGGINVDARLRTSRPTIYAAGDVAGPYAFTHMAEYQAGIVISNAVFRFPKKVDYRVVPWVTYSDPELARVGINAAEARQSHPDAEVLEFPFAGVDRALAQGESAGRIQLVVRKQRILGATILGPNAGELIHEIVLAMQARIKIGRISAAIHAYPTLAQIHRRAVNQHYAKQLFSERTKRLVRWLNRIFP